MLYDVAVDAELILLSIFFFYQNGRPTDFYIDIVFYCIVNYVQLWFAYKDW